MLALVLMQQGRDDEAIAILEQLRSTNPRYASAALGFAYGKAGRVADAAEMLRDIERLSTPKEPMPAQERALVYIGMRDYDKAFETLEEVYRDRFAGLAFLTADPIYDGLRPDPRYADLARRVNLTR
jgi:tetratricopeptide (TPR) repeat protein